MASKDKSVQIYPKRRETDAARLARALLHLIDRLSPSDRARFAAEGQRVLKDIKAQERSKGSAV